MGAWVGSDRLARKSRHRREPVVGLNVVARGGEDHGQGTIGGVAPDGVQELCAQQRWSDKAEPPRNAEQRVRQIVLSVDSGRSKAGLNNEREDLATRTRWTGWTAIGCHCHPLVEASREEAQAGLAELVLVECVEAKRALFRRQVPQLWSGERRASMSIGVPHTQESTQERHKQSIPATMRGERSTGSTAAHFGIAQASRETRRLAEPLPGGLRDDAGGGRCTQKREEFRSKQELADHVDLNDRLKPILRLLSGVPRRAAAPSVEAQHVEPLQAITILAAFAITQ